LVQSWALRPFRPSPAVGRFKYDGGTALVVGINHYTRVLFDEFTGPSSDAAEVTAELRNRYGFKWGTLLIRFGLAGLDRVLTGDYQ
jgi:hypothetical protein